MPLHPPPALDDPEIAARAMLARKRRFLLTVAGNALLLVLLVGGPYVRGILRARAVWPRFATASVCIFGGKPSAEPGLGVPRGHEERFAAQVLNRPADFPQRCDALLAKLPPEPAIFLLPWLKTAEYELGEATRVMREELRKVPPRGSDMRISTRPLRAFELLRAALSRHALASGLGAPPEALAFAFDQAPTLREPTRVPLFVGGDAVLSIWGDDRRFEALGIDSNGLSYLSMEAGTLWPLRLTRPKLLQAFLPDNTGGVFVWAMAQARCRDRSDGCTGKTLGLARVRFPLSSLPEPRWFASHPAGRADRSVLDLGDGWLLAAAAQGGATELREFAALENSTGAPAQDLPPLSPRAQIPNQARGQVLLTHVSGAPFVLNAAASQQETTLAQITPQGEFRPLASLPGGDRGWVVGSAAKDRVDFAFGHGEALRLGHANAQGQATLWDSVALRTHAVVHDTDPARDHVLRLRSEKTALALVLTVDAKLVLVSCSEGSSRCTLNTLDTQVRGFAGQVTAEGALVAYAGTGERAQIRVLRVDAQGKVRTPVLTPGACWSDARGMCGPPVLARLGARIMLGAREGTDLLALESPDEGATWEPLRGIRKQE